VANENGRSISAKQVVVGILVVVVVALAIANLDDAEVSLVFHTFTMPLIVVIVGAAAIGWVIGWFMGRNRNE
jgi:uncharacterized integral membrane protein